MSSERKEKDKKRLKKAAFIVLAAFGALAVLYGITLVISLIFKSDKIPTRVVDESITFSDVNYDFDIFSDPIYASKDINITLNEYGDVFTIGSEYEGDDSWHGMAPLSVYEREGADAAFFREYFVCLISGDYEKYPTFFTENFFRYYTIPKKFTMQKIYSISVEVFNRGSADDKNDGSVVSEYIVRYKIMNNNGTFRGDVPSDTIKPLYFKLIETNGIIAIDSISFVQNKKAND